MSQGTAVMPIVGPLSMASWAALANTAFAAAISQSAGATAPSTFSGQPTQGQPWLDNSITVPKLRIYDGSSWPVLAYLSTVFHVASPVSQSSDSVVSSTLTAYTLGSTDWGRTLLMNSSLANVVTIPASSVTNFPIGTIGELVMYGAGQTKLTPGSSVTIRSIKGTSVNVSAQYGVLRYKKIGADEWLVDGNGSTV